MSDLVERYLALGLRLGRHVDGFVDAYYGPPELAARMVEHPHRHGDSDRKPDTYESRATCVVYRMS